jgi:hypothetical protein
MDSSTLALTTLAETGCTMQIKIDSITIMEILIKGGMLFQLNTGATRKNPESLVETIIKPRSSCMT